MNTMLICLAAIELVFPKPDQTVQLIPDLQRTVLQKPTMEERAAVIAESASVKKSSKKKKHHSRHADSGSDWRQSQRVVFSWKSTNGENGPWEILISKNPDLSDARQFLIRSAHVDSATGRETGEKDAAVVHRESFDTLNLEIATRYYWRVASDITCGSFGHGRKCSCKKRRPSVESAIGSFVTEDLAPRWIAIEGRTKNFRDLGGRIGFGGKRVRQGLIYRSQGLNDNSIDGVVKGKNRLTVSDVEYLTGTLGIRTDLDIRGNGETAGMNGVSPLGKDVRYVHRPSNAYRGIFEEKGKKVMAENFREFLDRKNYPIVLHCIGGADRAGSLSYVLNGALGVKRQELETDWESTFYPNIPDVVHADDPGYWCRESHFTAGFSKYGDANSTWTDRIVLYLKDCGITDQEIETFRGIMLQD